MKKGVILITIFTLFLSPSSPAMEGAQYYSSAFKKTIDSIKSNLEALKNQQEQFFTPILMAEGIRTARGLIGEIDQLVQKPTERQQIKHQVLGILQVANFTQLVKEIMDNGVMGELYPGTLQSLQGLAKYIDNTLK